MSYAIIRNEKLTRAESYGAYVHNDRKAKNHSNKEIDISKSYLNYYFKRNELSYTKAFDKMKEKYDIIGDVRGIGGMLGVEFVKDKESKAVRKD